MNAMEYFERGLNDDIATALEGISVVCKIFQVVQLEKRRKL